MRAKEYLEKLYALDVKINQKIIELKDLQAIPVISAVDYAKEFTKGSSPTEASFVKKIHKIIELMNEINAEIDEFIDFKHLIINQIQALQNPIHIELLFKRYVEFKKFKVIAEEMNYTEQYIYELHGSAIKEFQTTYKILLNSYISK